MIGVPAYFIGGSRNIIRTNLSKSVARQCIKHERRKSSSTSTVATSSISEDKDLDLLYVSYVYSIYIYICMYVCMYVFDRYLAESWMVSFPSQVYE